jgi:hypothetical protein
MFTDSKGNTIIIIYGTAEEKPENNRTILTTFAADPERFKDMPELEDEDYVWAEWSINNKTHKIDIVINKEISDLEKNIIECS